MYTYCKWKRQRSSFLSILCTSIKYSMVIKTFWRIYRLNTRLSRGKTDSSRRRNKKGEMENRCLGLSSVQVRPRRPWHWRTRVRGQQPWLLALFHILNPLNIQKWRITQDNLDIMRVASQQLDDLRHRRPVARVRLGAQQPDLHHM